MNALIVHPRWILSIFPAILSLLLCNLVFADAHPTPDPKAGDDIAMETFIRNYIDAVSNLPAVDRMEVLDQEKPAFSWPMIAQPSTVDEQPDFGRVYLEAEAQYYHQILSRSFPELANITEPKRAKEVLSGVGPWVPEAGEQGVDRKSPGECVESNYHYYPALDDLASSSTLTKEKLFGFDAHSCQNAAGLLISNRVELLGLSKDEVKRLVWVCEYTGEAKFHVDQSVTLLRRCIEFRETREAKRQLLEIYLQSQVFCGSAGSVGGALWLGGPEIRQLAIEACDNSIREGLGNDCFINQVGENVVKGGIHPID